MDISGKLYNIINTIVRCRNKVKIQNKYNIRPIRESVKSPARESHATVGEQKNAP